MADTPYTPTYENATDLTARGRYISGAVSCYGIDNHPSSMRQTVTRWIAQVEWNRANLTGGSMNRQWLGLAGTVERLEFALNRR